MESTIHVKDSTIKQFPYMAQDFLSPLFIDTGLMPDRKGKGKTKTCHIYINLTGIYFLRPKKLNKFKVSVFQSTLAIYQIKYIDQKRRSLVLKNEDFFFECSHADEAIQCLLAAKKLLLSDSNNFQNIPLIGFPSGIPEIQLNPPSYNLTAIRYIVYCAKFLDVPSKSFVDFFNNVDQSNCFMLTLDPSLTPPMNMKSVLLPILHLNNVRIIKFVNFAPFGVLKLVHFLIKRAALVNNFILEGYTHLAPIQLKLNYLKPKKVLSFSFIDCRLQNQTYADFIDCLSQYPGEVQKISFNGISLSTEVWASILETIITTRPFRTLESLEFDNIESKNVVGEDIPNDINTLLKHCRFLQRVSIANWTNPANIGIEAFVNCSILSEITISKENMTEVFQESIRIPLSVHLLDFSKCSFTYSSLQSLFNIISQVTRPLVLVLSDLAIPEAHWRSFFAALPTIKPIKCLRGLDWSGNMLENTSIQPFVRYFFGSNPIRYLAINRVFNSQSIGDLNAIFQAIGPNRIDNLSICGNAERNFNGSISALLNAISQLGNINVLTMNGQHFSNEDSEFITRYIKTHPNLIEFSADESNINSEGFLYQFYSGILTPTLKIVGRPNKDLSRLIPSKQVDLTNIPAFDSFKKAIQEKCEPIGVSLVAFYYCKYEISDRMEPSRYVDFHKKYPIIFFSDTYSDYFFLRKMEERLRYPTLALLGAKNSFPNLASIHTRFVSDPEKIPRYRAPANASTPINFDGVVVTEPILGAYNESTNKDPTLLEPLRDTSEMLDVLNILADITGDGNGAYDPNSQNDSNITQNNISNEQTFESNMFLSDQEFEEQQKLLFDSDQQVEEETAQFPSLPGMHPQQAQQPQLQPLSILQQNQTTQLPQLSPLPIITQPQPQPQLQPLPSLQQQQPQLPTFPEAHPVLHPTIHFQPQQVMPGLPIHTAQRRTSVLDTLLSHQNDISSLPYLTEEQFNKQFNKNIPDKLAKVDSVDSISIFASPEIANTPEDTNATGKGISLPEVEAELPPLEAPLPFDQPFQPFSGVFIPPPPPFGQSNSMGSS